ncbi:hypothetical protein BH11MYX4_BH11MYX4_12930 [soil metagenome]
MSATHPFDAKHPHALAMYCSDGRFTEAIEELLRGLGHARLDTLTIPGGPALLDLTSSGLGAVDVMRDAASFLIRGHAITQVVLLGHEGCGYDKARYAYESTDAMRRRQLSDLRQAAHWVRGAHQGLAVATYFAIPEGSRVRFDEV